MNVLPVRNKRLTLAITTGLMLMVVGVVAWVYSPENLDKLRDYMILVVAPTMTFIIGDSIRKSEP
jgi:hypothetical protein